MRIRPVTDCAFAMRAILPILNTQSTLHWTNMDCDQITYSSYKTNPSHSYSKSKECMSCIDIIIAADIDVNLIIQIPILTFANHRLQRHLDIFNVSCSTVEDFDRENQSFIFLNF